MKETMEGAARDVHQSIQTNVSDFEKQVSDDGSSALAAPDYDYAQYPEYKRPQKRWRLKQGATPQWFKARTGVRTKALSGAARVARYRPQKIN